MLEVIPGILEKDWNEIERKLNLAKSFAKTVQIDIIDGKFAPNATFLDPKPFAKYAKDLFLEVHLMVEDPIRYLDSFAKAGFKRFIGHIEKMPDQKEFIVKGEELGEIGLAVDGPTPLNLIKVPYQDLDCLLLMAVKAGQSGQVFNPEYLKKIETLRSDKNNLQIPIEVDGGVNCETILSARDKGINRFVSTNFIFGAENPQEQFNLLNSSLTK
jgi:ribulose-phosphate 3-epimerase